MPVEICPLPKTRNVDSINAAFESIYKKTPTFYIRVPGRVNLIGEHVDYCGYGVCPMALEQDIFLAVATDDTQKKLNLHNLDKKYESYECPLDTIEIVLNDAAPKWYQYFLCGVKGVLELLGETERNKIKGLEVMVDGSIPQSAGLSSSSALVSAAALATTHSFQVCCAKLIEFEPLRSAEVQLPPGAVFVIAHSMAKMNKAATTDFNSRVVECRLAAQIIGQRKGLDWTGVRRLGDLQKTLGVTLDEMIALTKEILHERPYSKEGVIRELNTTSTQLDRLSLTPNTRDIQSFKLHQRALHVFNEAKRVQQFYETCKNMTGGEDSLLLLGNLMSRSHESLKELYECSHEALDRIVDLAKGLTLGTRLTGAGWGGCTVSLVASENVEKFVNLLIESFYKPLGVTDGFESLVFRTEPMDGARVYTPITK
ncbi:hypothetical protein GWI33_014632 [Rhynchophorus ferrugineus]|uniref:N-acetylgalactosamine kinase n=1 Tax=Rhynchophorus ferrugineus TaxID=354439 RepID=A0A834I711_RHYFE|nr:hypothetical protein GWI33_014632 [Rhynchophorus ferrugineus]